MANAMIHKPGDLLAPMIDARRMEVYTALYDKSMKEILSPRAMIINENSYSEYLATKRILFFGNGSQKLQTLLKHENSAFELMQIKADNMASLAEKSYQNNRFADLAYTEPLYLKDFYSSSQIN
jgi:tRNA threonylcarbamoyladenosine biosynthesis protein TsaB